MTTLTQRRLLRDIRLKVEQLDRCEGYVQKHLLYQVTLDALRLTISLKSSGAQDGDVAMTDNTAPVDTEALLERADDGRPVPDDVSDPESFDPELREQLQELQEEVDADRNLTAWREE